MGAFVRGSNRRGSISVRGLAGQRQLTHDSTERIDAALDATDRWRRVSEAITALPEAERDTVVLHVWEGLADDQIAAALNVPVGTVRSRLNRARHRLRELEAANGKQYDELTNWQSPWEDHVVSDDFDPLRRLRPDRIEHDTPGDPAIYTRAKEQFMTMIDQNHVPAATMPHPRHLSSPCLP